MRTRLPGSRALIAVIAVFGLLIATASEALAVEERTLGGMTTNSGKSCTLTVRVTSTTKSTAVLSNIDWLTQVSCTAGANGWGIDSFLKSELYEVTAGRSLRPALVNDAESDSGCAQTPADPCVRSGTYSTGIPGQVSVTRYEFIGEAARLSAHLDLTPGGPDDWWTAWPPQCTAYFDTFGTPGPRHLECPRMLVSTTGF